MIINAACITVPAAIWIASIQVENPDRLALVWIAIFLGQSSDSQLWTRDAPY